jgi:LPXTG-site transpeptidase (sortase) family protein
VILTAVFSLLLAWQDGVDPPPDFGSRAEASAERRSLDAPAPTGSGSATAGAELAAPVRLTTTRVGISARVVPVGTDRARKVEIPGSPEEVGWYRYGPQPGAAAGSAVLVGHVDFRTGDLGQFARLYDVKAGDTVTVGLSDGTAVRYRVTARRTYDKERLPDELFRRAGEPVLTLITCAPPYDADSGGYRRNLVVTAQPLP